MSQIIRITSAAALVATLGAGAVLAQADGNAADTGPDVSEPQSQTAEPDDGSSPDDGLNMGQSVADDNAVGQSYVADSFGDWEQRCIRTEDGNDPCQLYQLLNDDSGNSVAEMSIFALPEGRQAAAGSTIITPLETLLTEQVTIAVDNGQAKRYPFDFCAQAGCFARIGFTAAEVAAFKRGNEATLSIVPAAAPDQTIELTISLSGFTAGYDATASANEGIQNPAQRNSE